MNTAAFYPYEVEYEIRRDADVRVGDQSPIGVVTRVDGNTMRIRLTGAGLHRYFYPIAYVLPDKTFDRKRPRLREGGPCDSL